MNVLIWCLFTDFVMDMQTLQFLPNQYYLILSSVAVQPRCVPVVFDGILHLHQYHFSRYDVLLCSTTCENNDWIIYKFTLQLPAPTGLAESHVVYIPEWDYSRPFQSTLMGLREYAPKLVKAAPEQSNGFVKIHLWLVAAQWQWWHLSHTQSQLVFRQLAVGWSGLRHCTFSLQLPHVMGGWMK